jgi:hypothetical protein
MTLRCFVFLLFTVPFRATFQFIFHFLPSRIAEAFSNRRDHDFSRGFRRFDWEIARERYECWVRVDSGCVGLGNSDVAGLGVKMYTHRVA